MAPAFDIHQVFSSSGFNTLASLTSFSSCDTWYKIIAALSVIGRAAVIVTFSAHTYYAVFARSKAILLYLAAIGLACIILDIVWLSITLRP
ncbi:hypothetical protein ARMGADRAFT_1169096 [Armillaria gallica]|uniref:Uncharacterized protein n=1 Tax=Armillaria gallica TaxID=47427 RepID=A0A2H3CUC7_ARMGA|nr:hypothetical protein ARMGADRAFT_1169096 [Armillaria gallica]